MECSICKKSFKQKNLLLKHLKLKKTCKIDEFKFFEEKLNEIKQEDIVLKNKQVEEILSAPVVLTPKQIYDKQRYVPVKNVVRKAYPKKNQIVLEYDRGIALPGVKKGKHNITHRNNKKRLGLKQRNAEYAVSIKAIAEKLPEYQQPI